MKQQVKRNYAPLHQKSIRYLSLSSDTSRKLRDTGIHTIGDCLDFFHYDYREIEPISYEARSVMHSEVKGKLKAQGYWHFVETSYTRLYALSIDDLNLSQKTLKMLHSIDIDSAGDLIDFYRNFGTIIMQDDRKVLRTMMTEIHTTLLYYDYWYFVEDSMSFYTGLPEVPYESLYYLPVEALRLSEKAEKGLKRTGILSVGDCIDMLQRLGDSTGGNIRNFGIREWDELREKLMQHNYWYLTGEKRNWFDY